MNKPTEAILQEANSLYNQISFDSPSEFQSLCNTYNGLIEQYDFNNQIFSDDNGLKGLKICTGEVIVPAKYDDIPFFKTFGVPTDEIIAICKRENKSFLINHLGEELLEADEIVPVNGCTIIPVAFNRDGKWGIAYSEEIKIADAHYDKVIEGSNGFYFLELDGKMGFVDPWNNVIEPIFDSITIDSDDYLEVALNGITGYVDEDGDFTTDREEAYYNINLIL